MVQVSFVLEMKLSSVGFSVELRISLWRSLLRGDGRSIKPGTYVYRV